jgi:hypothetical protein
MKRHPSLFFKEEPGEITNKYFNIRCSPALQRDVIVRVTLSVSKDNREALSKDGTGCSPQLVKEAQKRMQLICRMLPIFNLNEPEYS